VYFTYTYEFHVPVQTCPPTAPSADERASERDVDPNHVVMGI